MLRKAYSAGQGGLQSLIFCQLIPHSQSSAQALCFSGIPFLLHSLGEAKQNYHQDPAAELRLNVFVVRVCVSLCFYYSVSWFKQLHVGHVSVRNALPVAVSVLCI